MEFNICKDRHAVKQNKQFVIGCVAKLNDIYIYICIYIYIYNNYYI